MLLNQLRLTLVLAIPIALVAACGDDSARSSSPGLDRPMTDTELAEFTACEEATECVVVMNAPPDSGGCSCGITNPVAINADMVMEFRDAFVEPEPVNFGCDIACPELDEQFRDGRYVLACDAKECTIAETRADSGRSCSDTSPCPADFNCVPNSGSFPEMACLWGPAE